MFLLLLDTCSWLLTVYKLFKCSRLSFYPKDIWRSRCGRFTGRKFCSRHLFRSSLFRILLEFFALEPFEWTPLGSAPARCAAASVLFPASPRSKAAIETDAPLCLSRFIVFGGAQPAGYHLMCLSLNIIFRFQ